MHHTIDLCFGRKEAICPQFEDLAIPLISKYNGRLTLRIRPNSAFLVENSIEVPYEIHCVEFDTAQDFDNFKNDDTRKTFLHLKKVSVKSALLVQGTL